MFTLTNPIVTDQDVLIQAGPGTTLIIGAQIQAANLRIVAGEIRDEPGGVIVVSGTTSVIANSGGDVILDNDTNDFNVVNASGEDIVLADANTITLGTIIASGEVNVSANTGGGITVSGAAPDTDGGTLTISTAAAGSITVSSSSSAGGGDAVLTAINVSNQSNVALGNVTVSSETPIALTGVSIRDAAAPANASTPTDLAAAEAPIAILQTTAGDIAVVLDASSLTPLEADLGGAGLSSELYRASDFAGKLFSCPQSAPDRRFDEGTCAYATGGIDRLESDNGASEFDDTTWAFTMGAQAEVAENIFVGGALAYESSQTDTAATDRETQRGRGGLVVKYDDGAISAGLALSAGYGAIDTSRAVVSGTTSGETDATTLEARARVAYGLRFGELAVEPSVAASVLYVEEDGYTETGTALANRQVSATDVTTAGLHAGLSFGTNFVAGPYQTRIRPELNLGLDWFADPDVSVSATGATGRALFQNVEADHLTGTVSAGITVFAADDIALRLRYAGRFGESTTGHGGEVKLTLGF
ncbi:MAG: autotransporter domain-containing protein [Pseudomonadota bacterium]